MIRLIVITTKRHFYNGGKLQVKKGTKCVYSGANDRQGNLIVLVMSRKGVFYPNRHLPKSLFY
ncbi:hypothetical protein DTQ70_07155 [Runella sp. SP2]|nr:hypothetical protein DTQ70_07155 [Runella sp. SP2]